VKTLADFAGDLEVEVDAVLAAIAELLNGVV
jgi:hypothetical protein